MAFKKLLLNSSLIFIAAIAFFTSGNLGDDTLSNNRLPDYIVPEHYNIKLSPIIKLIPPVESIFDNISTLVSHMMESQTKYNFFFSGESEISIKIDRPTEDIYFHLLREHINLWSIELINGNGINFELIGHRYYYEPHIFVLNYNQLPIGRYTLKLNFTCFSVVDNINSSFVSSYAEGGKESFVFATLFRMYGARRMFPCWDEPKFRATFSISVYHHSNYTVLSNMPVRATDTEEYDMRWTHFETTLPIPINFVAITVNEFSRVHSIGKISVFSRSVLKDDVEFANIIAEKVTSQLESEWNNMKRIPKVDLVAIPLFPSDSMSNIGLIFYREDSLICNEKHAARKMEVARLIGYKITYQLFDGIINPSSWYDLSINEGLSLLIGMDAVDKIFPQTMNLFIVQDQYDSLQLNSYVVMAQKEINGPSEINSYFSWYSPRYIKAFCLLRMLQHLLSHDIFRKGVQMYLNKHELHSATSNNLWIAMQNAFEKMDLTHKPDIKKVMDSWLQQQHYPIVKVIRNNDGWVVAQVINFRESSTSWIPLTYTTQSNSNFNNTSIFETLWLKCLPDNDTQVGFSSNPKRDNWIIINLQQSGYYRVNYDDKTWLEIAMYLKTSNYTNIHVLNRAKLIDDAFYLVLNRDLNVSIFWNLTSYLSQETNFTAWYPMFKAFEHIATILPFSDKRVEKIKAKMYNMLDGVLKNTGYDENTKEKEDFTKRLMKEAAKWACLIRHPGCMLVARDDFHQFLRNPTKKKPLSWWQEWTCCNGLIALNVNWFKLTSKWINPKLLGCSDDTSLVIKHLELIANKENDDHIIVDAFHSIVARHSKHDVVLEYMLSHFEEINPLKRTAVATMIDIINHVYSKKQLTKISNFTKKYVNRHFSPSFVSSIEDKIKLRISQIDDQMNYIQRFIGESQ